MGLYIDKPRGPKGTRKKTITRKGGASKTAYFTGKPTKDKNRSWRTSKSQRGHTDSNILKGDSMASRKRKKAAVKRNVGKGPGTTKPRFSEKDLLGLGKMLNKLLGKGNKLKI